jgi:hypothetical protein
MTQIQKITIKGYKSIAKLEAFELCNLNVLIGAARSTDYFNIGDGTSCQSPSRRGKS